MRKLAPRSAIRALLALTLLLGSLGAWTAALLSSAGGQAERLGAYGLPRAEQVVQADRQPLSRVAVDRRGDLDWTGPVLLGILVGAALVGATRRWWDRGGHTIRSFRHSSAPARASRAPPRLGTA